MGVESAWSICVTRTLRCHTPFHSCSTVPAYTQPLTQHLPTQTSFTQHLPAHTSFVYTHPSGAGKGTGNVPCILKVYAAYAVHAAYSDALEGLKSTQYTYSV